MVKGFEIAFFLQAEAGKPCWFRTIGLSLLDFDPDFDFLALLIPTLITTVQTPPLIPRLVLSTVEVRGTFEVGG